MKNILYGLFLAASLLSTAQAQPAASVEAVQMPAWVERDGRRTALLPGMELRAGDQILTGKGSRALVRLAEGSVVKLGENGTLRFAKIDRSTEIFRAALGVLQGAFRFTTELLGQQKRRDVEIRVATVTAGIRGTDLWGRGRKDNEVVCLIEGEIQVAAEGEAAQTLNQPLQFYRRIDAKTQPIGSIDVQQLADWARETELEDGKGVARGDGRFGVLLATAPDQPAALALYDQLRAAGYPAEILPRKEGEQVVYVLRIRRLASRADAQAIAEQLKGKFGITEPRITG